jgi:serine/threonine-protein kinase
MEWRRAGRAVALLVAGGALLGAAGLTAFCVTLRSDRRSDVVEVPDWTGRARTDALAQAQSLGLGFEVSELRHDPAIAVDRIVQQDPAPGTQVRHGRTIRVVVSKGGETLSVPDIVRHPARQAELELLRLGLTPGTEARVHDQAVPDGQVIDQAPSEGALSVPGEAVHRLVSEGPRPPRWVMPDLSGRTLHDVQEWITLCGFRGGAIRRVPPDGRRSGTVVGQLPLSGYPIAKRDVVELTVAE